MIDKYPWLARSLFWDRNYPLPDRPDPNDPGYGDYRPGDPVPIPPPPSYNPEPPRYGGGGGGGKSNSNNDDEFSYKPGKVREVPYEEIPFPEFDPLSPNQVLSGWRKVMARRRGKKEQWKQQELEIQKYSAETGAHLALMQMWMGLLKSIFGGLGG